MWQASLFAMALLTLSSAAAEARSRHEAPTVSALTSGGRTTGFKLKVRLINADGHQMGAVGLVPRDKATTSLSRQAAIRVSDGVLRYQFPPVTGMTAGETREVEFQVTYGTDNNLQSGEQLSVISAWASKLEDTGPHVWGACSQNGGPEFHIQLP